MIITAIHDVEQLRLAIGKLLGLGWQGAQATLEQTVRETLERFLDGAALRSVPVEALNAVFEFLPLQEPLRGLVLHVVQDVYDGAPPAPKERVRCERHSVAYLILQVHGTNAYESLIIPCRNLVVERGPDAVPPLVAACSALGHADKLTLSGEHVLSTLDAYQSKRSGKGLARATKASYSLTIKRLIRHVREVYSHFGYGGYRLFFSREEADAVAEETARTRFRRGPSGAPYLASPEVLKPQALLEVLLSGTEFTVACGEGFNADLQKLLAEMIFRFATKSTHLCRLNISDYSHERALIGYKIRKKRPLDEDVIHVPLDARTNGTVFRMLQIRAAIEQPHPSDRLFALKRGNTFAGLTKEGFKEALGTLSERAGVPVTEGRLYKTHQCYFQRHGGLNPVLDDRISDRRAVFSIVPRIYTQSSVRQLRDCHHAAGQKVAALLQTSMPVHVERPDERRMVSGGGRRMGWDKFLAAFAYLSRREDLEGLAMRIILLFNFFHGARLSEISSLTRSRVDFLLQAVKWRVKDTAKRGGTTKVIPLLPFIAAEIRKYLMMRESSLPGSSVTLFDFLEDRNAPSSGDFINERYRALARECGIPPFTTQSVRYESQTAFTRVGLSFEATNVVLGHYPFMDLIFSPTSSLKFTDFRREYTAACDRILEDLKL